MRMSIRSWGWTVGVLAGLLAGLWIAPPILRQRLGYCPVRPGGVSQAQAVPSFARKYDLSCSQCHTAFPALNDYGREFKVNGYVREQGNKQGVLEVKDGALWTLKHFPWGALVKSRPFEKRQSRDREFRFRALHELELFIAGGDASKNFSYFTEIEMEDENQELTDSTGGEVTGTNAYTPKVGELQLGYHPRRFFNVLVANRSFFVMDPYQTLGNMGLLTNSKRLFANTTGGVTKLDDMKQTAVINGELEKEGLGALYYAAGVTGQREDGRGRGYKSTAYRLAFDTLKGVMVGAFGHFGNENGPAEAPMGDKIRFSRAGVDALVEQFGFTGRTAFLYSFDKNRSTEARETNRGGYVEAFYTYKKDDRPLIVPLVRQDWYATDNSQRHFGRLTTQLAHYPLENVRYFIEYSGDTKQDALPGQPPRPRKDHIWFGQIEVGF